MENRDPLTEKNIAGCFKVHSELGSGFNERIYHNALKMVLNEEALEYQTEKEFPVYFKNKRIGSLILDLIIEGKVIIEVKSLAGNIPEVFKRQLLSYLKASKMHVGLLVNFGNKSCQIKRFML